MGRMLRIAIVEDSQLDACQLETLAQQYAKEYGTELEVKRFFTGMEIAEQYKPVWDIIFLDIDMPQLDGMSAAEHIRSQDPEVILIFVTNMAQYAIRGYEVDALAFLLKPVSYGAFHMKMRKAQRILASRSTQSVLLMVEGKTVKLDAADVYYVEVQDHQLIYHTRNGEYRMFGSLRSVEKQFSQGFARCNQCYLINLRHVDGVQEDGVQVGADTLKISRARKKEFMQNLSDYYRFGGR